MSEPEQPEADESSSVMGGDKRSSTRLGSLINHIRSSDQWPAALRWAAAAAIALVGAGALLWLVDKIVFYYLTKSYVDQIADAFDLNRHLANALLIATFAAAVSFTRLIWSFSRRSRLLGLGGIVLLLIGHSLALWYATRGNYFDTSGHAMKCYVLTRDGRVTYGERIGVDPTTGRACRPLTAEMLERLQQYAGGKRPQFVTVDDPTFFDPRTGEPIVWYSKAKDGRIELFDLMGFHPDTGDELLPITKEIVEAWKKQIAEVRRHVPKRINPESFVFFDPRSGAAKAWYWKDADGKYDFYDSAGFDPTSGEPLKVASRDIVEEWKKSAIKKAPTRIDPQTYAFFDPVSGAARVWYWRSKDGSYEFYDAPGYQPTTGEQLQLITKDIVEKWREATKEKRSSVQGAPSMPSAVAPVASSAPPAMSTAELELKARSFLFNYMRISGEDSPEVLRFVNVTFADPVEYFGKRMTKDRLIDDKRAYMARWPERSYELKPASIFTRCDAAALSCEVGGEFYFRAANGSKTSVGLAANRLVVAFGQDQPKILSENGNVIARGAEPAYPTPAYRSLSPADRPPYPLDDQQTSGFQQQNGIPPEQARQIMNGIFGTVIRQMGR